jgi:hypothetical protein
MRAVLFAALLVFAGCGRYAVRPDEKEHLADRIMRADADPVENAIDQHVFSNREGSAGGGAAGGGGCGCN